MTYRRGYVFELDIVYKLSNLGYYVIRSAGSHRLCDIIAIPSKSMNEELPLCVQCKKTSIPDQIPKISAKELSELRELEKTHRVKVLLAIRYRMRGRWKTELLTIDEYLNLRKAMSSEGKRG